MNNEVKKPLRLCVFKKNFASFKQTKMNQIAEAKRYIDNAKDILREKAIKEDGYYQDKKYIRMAGNTAYSGVLEALDAVIMEKIRGRKR